MDVRFKSYTLMYQIMEVQHCQFGWIDDGVYADVPLWGAMGKTRGRGEKYVLLTGVQKFNSAENFLCCWRERPEMKDSKAVNFAQNESVLSPARFRCDWVYPDGILMQMWQIKKQKFVWKVLGKVTEKKRRRGTKEREVQLERTGLVLGSSCWSSAYLSTNPF